MLPAIMISSRFLSLALGAEDLSEKKEQDPVAIFMNCQSQGRVKSCKYLKAHIRSSKQLNLAPRSTADVNLLINTVQQANSDQVQLRYLPTVNGVSMPVELSLTLDSRASVDQQRKELIAGFVKGLAPYMIATNPDALSVRLIEPKGKKKIVGSPWGWSISAGGWGNWMDDYQTASLNLNSQLQRMDEINKWIFRAFGRGWLERQPPLLIEDEEISLDSDTYSTGFTTYYSRNIDEKWTVGGTIRTGMSDPEAQFEWTGKTHVGIERNWFPINDPRGNKLSASYLIGGQWDRYNHLNQLGEMEAIFPSHALIVNGTIRKDTWELGLDLGARMELLQPSRRNSINARGWTEVFLGDHVDLRLSLGFTKQAIPGPASVDATDFESIKQANYAEPLQINGDFNIRLHWDATNGIRNNRFSSSAWLGELSNL